MARYSIRYLDKFGCAERTALGLFQNDEAACREALATLTGSASFEVWKHNADRMQDQSLVRWVKPANGSGTSELALVNQ